MKFLIDMPLPPQLVKWLEEQGHEAIHALQIGLDRAQDTVIIEYSRSHNQIIITADLDYPRILALTRESGPGLILFRGGNYSTQEIEEHLTRVFAIVSEEELNKSIIVIEKERIRKRSLPI